jgi:hypothetical protein
MTTDEYYQTEDKGVWHLFTNPPRRRHIGWYRPEGAGWWAVRAGGEKMLHQTREDAILWLVAGWKK